MRQLIGVRATIEASYLLQSGTSLSIWTMIICAGRYMLDRSSTQCSRQQTAYARSSDHEKRAVLLASAANLRNIQLQLPLRQ